MNRLKALTRPAIISMTVDRIFANSANESDGYLRINRDHGDFDKGGHAMMYVGYILNQNLPDGAPDANGGGYVVVKNSWGLNRHDCGFYYLDHDYVKERITGLVTIDI
jgi:C1A family cysteine protease